MGVEDTQDVEVPVVSDRPGLGAGTGQQQCTQMLAVLVASDQITDVLAGRAAAALSDLRPDERAKRLGKGDVHGRPR